MIGSPAYYPLLEGSPALNAGDNNYCPDKDQRGTNRSGSSTDACDIGAYEGSIPDITPTNTYTPTPVTPTDTPTPKTGTIMELSATCGLSRAIIAANLNIPFFGCPAGNAQGDGVDTIRLTKDVILLGPLPQIVSKIKIEGNGYTIYGNAEASFQAMSSIEDLVHHSIDGALSLVDDIWGVFHVLSVGHLTIDNLTIAGTITIYGGGAIK